MAKSVAASAFNLALLRDGWVFHMLPGESSCTKNGRQLQPFQVMNDVAARKMSLQQWEEICAINDLGKLSLEQTRAMGASS